jgi:hypothetical protein
VSSSPTAKEAFAEEAVDRLVAVAQHARVVGVGGHAAQAEQDEGFERAHVLVVLPELLHVVVVAAPAA